MGSGEVDPRYGNQSVLNFFSEAKNPRVALNAVQRRVGYLVM